MKIPAVPEDINQEIYRTFDQYSSAAGQRVRQYKKILLQVDHSLIVEGIIQVFEDKTTGERPYQEQHFAGKLLIELLPNTTLPLKELLAGTLPNYNLSVEELPLYLSEKFGVEAVAKTLREIEMENPDEKVRESIRVFKFWLHIP